MDLLGLFGHRTHRINVGVVEVVGRLVVDQLDARDFDDAVAGIRIEAGGFGIEGDFTHS